MTMIGENKQDKPKKVARGVYHIEVPTPFAVGSVNIYFLEGEYPTLVDVGPLTEQAWETVTQGLENIGYQIRDIRQVILTHHHVDHSGLLKRVREASGARIFAHPLAVPYVEFNKEFMDYHDRFFHELYHECGVPSVSFNVIEKYRKLITTFAEPIQIDEIVKHEQSLPHFPEWQVLYTPGHAQSHISLHRTEDRVMIAGDHIIKHISSNAFIEPPQGESRNRPLTLVQYRTALEMCSDKEIDIIYTGHGDPVSDHKELIDQRLQRNWNRTDKLRRLLQNGEKTAYELSELLFPELYQKELPLTISETLGHIDLLTILHQLDATRRDGILYYSV